MVASSKLPGLPAGHWGEFGSVAASGGCGPAAAAAAAPRPAAAAAPATPAAPAPAPAPVASSVTGHGLFASPLPASSRVGGASPVSGVPGSRPNARPRLV